MTPHYEHGSVTLYVGDCREVLAALPDQSVQCCVTSPPYFGLRDYGTAEWEGGDPACDHRNGVMASDKSGLHDGHGNYDGEKRAVNGMPYRDLCGKCGARRIDRQIGLEPTPQAYVAEMVAVFREVRRILRDDGTLWLNLGDSYATGKQGRADHGSDDPTVRLVGNSAGAVAPGPVVQRAAPEGFKHKDLLGIPWRTAFALQEDGWILRSDCIWHKPNPMPESVTDRPTRAHEYIFLLSKSARYYYDAEAIAEPSVYPMDARGARVSPAHKRMPTEMVNGIRGGERRYAERNKRSVWTVATQPFPDAHFATFPPKLIEPCILAGCPVGGVVLDAFAGAGTTLMVAQRFGRKSIGIELNAAYAEMAVRRLGQEALPLEVAG